MRVLVTGGSGFLGRHTIPRLRKAGLDVCALARTEASVAVVQSLGATALRGDLDAPDQLREVFASANADALLNIASLGFGHASAIVASASDAGIRRSIYVSTTAVETNLNAPSKRVRLAAEEAIMSSAVPWTIVRPTMIYGAPGDRNIERLLRFLRKAPLVPIPGGGCRLQQPVHVEDLGQALVDALLAPGTTATTYNLAGPEAMSFRRLVEEAKVAVFSRARLVPVPLRPAIWAVRTYEGVVSTPRIKSEQLERLAEDKAFPVEPASRAWGYAPRPFAVGVAQEVAALWP